MKIPVDPNNPSSSNVDLSLMSSTGFTAERLVIDSTGKNIAIIVAFKYPEYIKTSQLKIVAANDSIELDTPIFLISKNRFDSLRLYRKFTTQGEKRVTIISYIEDGSVKTDTAFITIFDRVKTAPKWKNVDTLKIELAKNSNFSLNLPDTCSDADGDIVSYFLFTGAPVGDTIINNTYLFSPTATDTGPFLIFITATDPSKLTDTLAIKIKVKQPDIIKSDSNFIKDTIRIHGAENSILDMNLRDSCITGVVKNLTFGCITAGPAGDTLYANGRYLFLPDYKDSGTFIFKANVTDGQLRDTFTIALTINNVNRKPVFQASLPKSSYQINEGDLLLVKIRAVDEDLDMMQFFLKETNLPRKNSCTFSDSALSWKSAVNDDGAYYLVAAVTDGIDTSTITIDIGIGNVNLPPVLAVKNVNRNQVITIKEADSLALSVTVSDPNAGDQPILLQMANAPFAESRNGFGKFDTISGEFLYIPSFAVSNKSNSATFQNMLFLAKDNSGARDTFNISIMVSDSNRAPNIALANPVNGARGIARDVDLSWSGSDLDNDSLKYTLYLGTLPEQLESVYNGIFQSYHNSSYFTSGTTYYYRVLVSDGKSSSTSTIRSFTINNVPQLSLKSPGNNSTGLAIPVSLTWEGTDIDPDDNSKLRYTCYISKFGESYVKLATDTSSQNVLLSNLTYSASYQWKIAVSDGKDTLTSPSYTFSTLKPAVTLKSLQSLQYNLAPAFQAVISTYTVSIPYEVDTLVFLAVTDDSLAILKVKDSTVKSGTFYTIRNIPTGDDTVNITVTARDGNTSQKYSIVIIRTKPNTFQKYFGRSEDDRGNDILQTSDSCFLIGGSLDNGPTGGFARVVKVNARGEQQWTMQYGNKSDYTNVKKLVNAQNRNTVALSNWVNPDSIDKPHVWLFEIDNGGLVQWEKIYRCFGYDFEYARSMIKTNDNGYLLVAHAQSARLNRSDIWLVKTSPAGIVEWDTVYNGGGSYGDVTCVSNSHDGGYIIGGYKRPIVGSDSTWLFKTNGNGGLLWSKTYPEFNNGSIKDLCVTGDGTIFICGAQTQPEYLSDGFISKLTPSGEIIRTTKISGDGEQNFSSIDNLVDGNFILTGWVTSNSNRQGWLLKVTTNCDTLWTNKFGGTGNDYFNCAKQCYDGGFIISGYLHNSGMWVLKTDRAGLIR